MPSIARIILDQTGAGVHEAEARGIDEKVEGDYKSGLY
jgi:hypothetical protein